MADLLSVERGIAQEAFDRTLPRQVSVFGGKDDREGCVAQLKDTYARFGLASGPHHADQLIRDIEAQGTAQAKQIAGRTP